jgi:hypothetical protein
VKEAAGNSRTWKAELKRCVENGNPEKENKAIEAK